MPKDPSLVADSSDPYIRTDLRFSGTKVCAHHQCSSEKHRDASTSGAEQETIHGLGAGIMVPCIWQRLSRYISTILWIVFEYFPFPGHAGYLEVQRSAYA